MPDYIYLLENRLSHNQQDALRHLREVAREAGMLLFLIGDAVRDLTSGHAVRDIEVVVQGNPLKLKKTLEKQGAQIWGEDEASRTLYLCFHGTVRVDLVGAHRVEYLKPGKSAYHPASIHEDMRRRDFTVNSMAISLNEGSFGLLMDPLNGAADIEARILRLVSNYGFIEDPSLMIRLTRYRARLGWEPDVRTLARYENAKAEGIIDALTVHARSRELEQIGHEDEALKVLRALDVEGWMKALFPAWTPAKADEERLQRLHDLAVELLVQGVHPDMSAAQMQLLTAKLSPREVGVLKKMVLRHGFVEEWNSLDALAAGFAKVLLAKENAIPSAAFKLFKSYDPEAILWLGFTSKNAAVQERFNQFLKVWPEARQRIPHATMQEMRITPELPGYLDLVEAIFLQLIDGKLGTPEETRAFLEPHSPPAPPPQITIKRPRVKRGVEAKAKESAYDDGDEVEAGLDEEDGLDSIGGDDDELDPGIGLPKLALDEDLDDDADVDEDDEAEPGSAKGNVDSPSAKPAKSAPARPVAGRASAAPTAAKQKPGLPRHTAKKPEVKAPQKQIPEAKPTKTIAKPAPAKLVAAKALAKPAPKAVAKPALKASAKQVVKALAKPTAKGASKAKPAQSRPSKGKIVSQLKTKPSKPVKAATRKPAPKAGKRR